MINTCYLLHILTQRIMSSCTTSHELSARNNAHLSKHPNIGITRIPLLPCSRTSPVIRYDNRYSQNFQLTEHRKRMSSDNLYPVVVQIPEKIKLALHYQEHTDHPHRMRYIKWPFLSLTGPTTGPTAETIDRPPGASG